MKNTFITLMLGYSIFSTAQLKAGRVFAGGEFGIGNIYTGTATNQDITIKFNPYVGFMVTDKVGLQFNMGYSNIPDPVLTGSISNLYKFNIVFGGIAVPIFIPLSEKFTFYIAPSINILSVNRQSKVLLPSQFTNNGFTYSYPNDNQTNFAMIIGVSPGITYFPHKNIGLNLSLGSFANMTYYFSSSIASFDFLNLSTNGPSLGINFWFGKIE